MVTSQEQQFSIPVHRPGLKEKLFFFTSGILGSVPLTLFISQFADPLRSINSHARSHLIENCKRTIKLAYEEIAAKTVQFKGKYNVPVADAFITATAHFEGSNIISNAADFKRIPEIEVLAEKICLAPVKITHMRVCPCSF